VQILGRVLLYGVIALLAVFVLGSTFLLDHGGGSTSAHQPVSVHDLRLLPEAYRGHTVTTEGDLHFSPELNQFEVVDSERQAIAVRGYGQNRLQDMVGKTVIVTGRFEIDADAGIYIEIESIGVTQ
jgi:hypothetical protein